jgi:hypothetical protein
MREVPGLLMGLGLVFEGMGDHFDWERIQRFWGSVVHFSRIELSPDSWSDVEYGHEVLGAVSCAFLGIIECAHAVARHEEQPLSRHADFVRRVKSGVFPLFEKIWTLGALNETVVRHVIGLTRVLLRCLGSALNVRLRDRALARILTWARYQAKDEDVRSAAWSVFGDIHRA